MKTFLKILIFLVTGTCAFAQYWSPQAPTGGFMETKVYKQQTLTVRGNTDTVIVSGKTPVFGVWKNDTAITVLGVHKNAQDSITYLLKYRVVDPQGTYLNNSTTWTTAMSATLYTGQIFYYKYTPGTAYIEWQLTAYYNGPTSYSKTGTLTVYGIEFKQK